MEKKFEDEELDQLIDEQFIKEAQMMEEAIFSDDDDSEDYEASDEEIKASYQKLVDRLKADGIYREDDKAEDTADVPETAAAEDKVVPIAKKRNPAFRRKFAKVAGFVVVSAMCVFAASMTSEANRDYFVKHVGVLMGDDTRVIIDNDENNEKVNTDEYKARDDIERKLDIVLPRFFYRPDEFDFYNYEVDAYAQFARIEYKYKEHILVLYISKEDETVASLMESIHGNTIEIFTMLYEDIDVEIKEILGKDDKIPSYNAHWDRNKVIYNLSGKIELEELKKIIENIQY